MILREKRWVEGFILVFILFVAAGLRWTGLDWDEYSHHHPDERYITWVATTIEWPSDWTTAFDPVKSSFNPYYWPTDGESEGIGVLRGEPRKFAYGHFPLYLGVAATRLTEWVAPTLLPLFPDSWLFTSDILNGRFLIEYKHLTAVSRALTGLFDLGTLIFVYLLGRQLFDSKVGLLAAAFLAVNVMHIQLAHFFAVDPYLTFFVVGAIYFMVRATDKEQGLNLMLAALFVGLAVGAKFSAVMLFLPLLITIWWSGRRRRGVLLITAVFFAILTFAITNPFAIIDQTCDPVSPAKTIVGVDIPSIDWNSCYLDNIISQSGMVRGGDSFPFTRQYEGTTAYLYPIEMQLRWGMGWLLGVVAFAGFVTFIAGAFRVKVENARIKMNAAPANPIARALPFKVDLPSAIVLAWTVPFFLVTGSFYVKFMRYMQPLIPFLMIFAAALLWRIGTWISRINADKGINNQRSSMFVGAFVTFVLLPTAVYAFAFVNMYQQPHPWADASAWIYENAPSGSLILSERWDDALPKSMMINGRSRDRAGYRQEELTWLSGINAADNEAKLDHNVALLAQADYLTLATNRIYGVVPRLPEMYPLSSQYHQLLLDGALGYEVVAINGRFPTLFNLAIQPDTFGWPNLQPSPAITAYLQDGGVLADKFVWQNGRADESFLVYDQPLTIVFKNVEEKTAVEMRALFDLYKTN